MSKNHYYFLNEEFLNNRYIRENFKIKIISHTDYALTSKLCSIFFIIKRTSENCYQVSSVSDYKTEFKSFKKAVEVMHYVEDLTRCIEMLDVYKKLGIEFNLNRFTWNLLGFSEYFGKIKIRKSSNSDLNFKELQAQFHKDLYYQSRFSSRYRW